MTNNRNLKTKKARSSAVHLELYEQLKKLSNETKIPMSKLLDETIEDLLSKHKHAQ